MACQDADATGCMSVKNISKGNYNKAYQLVMQDGQKIIANTPHLNAGPSMHTTASEVATMDFVRTILDLSVTDRNPVESEYIIMEEVKGSRLHKIWNNLQLRAKRDIIHEIVIVEKKMLLILFKRNISTTLLYNVIEVLTVLNRIASMYFKDSGILGCETTTTTEISQKVRDAINSRFSTPYWSCGPKRVLGKRKGQYAPASRQIYVFQRSSISHTRIFTYSTGTSAVAQREIDWIKSHGDHKKEFQNP